VRRACALLLARPASLVRTEPGDRRDERLAPPRRRHRSHQLSCVAPPHGTFTSSPARSATLQHAVPPRRRSPSRPDTLDRRCTARHLARRRSRQHRQGQGPRAVAGPRRRSLDPVGQLPRAECVPLSSPPPDLVLLAASPPLTLPFPCSRTKAQAHRLLHALPRPHRRHPVRLLLRRHQLSLQRLHRRVRPLSLSPRPLLLRPARADIELNVTASRQPSASSSSSARCGSRATRRTNRPFPRSRLNGASPSSSPCAGLLDDLDRYRRRVEAGGSALERHGLGLKLTSSPSLLGPQSVRRLPLRLSHPPLLRVELPRLKLCNGEPFCISRDLGRASERTESDDEIPQRATALPRSPRRSSAQTRSRPPFRAPSHKPASQERARQLVALAVRAREKVEREEESDAPRRPPLRA